MNNPPFAIGQKVVALQTRANDMGVKIIKGKIYNVNALYFTPCCGIWYADISLPYVKKGISYCNCGEVLFVGKENTAAWVHNCFLAPIITNYSDATAEILEKFKSPNESPDKIIVPEKVH